MEQQQLPLIGMVVGKPRVATAAEVAACKSYRDACRHAWTRRIIKNMTQRDLAMHAELRPQLVSDYLNADDKPQRKSLPAERIALFEQAVGSSLVSQWLAAQSKLTVLEEVMLGRMAA